MSIATAPFRLERDMFDHLVAAVPDLFAERGERLRVVREPTIGEVIPDILIGTWNGDLPYERSLTNVARHILAWLQGRDAKLVARDKLEEELFLTELATSRALTQLTRAGAVMVHDSGELQLLQDYRAHNVNLIAIEMKMCKWRQALAQAVAYLRFADEAYVVIDGNQVQVTKSVVKEFELYPVGLLAQRGDLVETVVQAVRATRAPSADRLLALQKLVMSGPYSCA